MIRPQVQEISRIATQICERDRAGQSTQAEIQPPSCKIDPVWPPLSFEEYDMLEQDTAKYFLQGDK